MSLRDVIRAAAGKPRAADEDPPEDEDRDTEPEAEEDDPPADESAEGEDDDEAEGEEDQEPEAEEDEDKPAEARARARERKRIRAILRSPAAADHPGQAAHLAFNTDLSSLAAIGILKSAGRPARGSTFGGRMGRTANPNLGVGGSGGGKGSPDRLVEFARKQAEAKRKRRA